MAKRSGIPPKHPGAVELGRRGGLKGGPARMGALTKKQRSALGRKGALARWGEKRRAAKK